MFPRFFCEVPAGSQEVVLSGNEAHHLVSVLRAEPGARVVLFDGAGNEYLAQVQSCSRREAALAILLQKTGSDRELDRPITLAVALPKGERQRWLVEKLVELGVTRMVPLITARSVAQPTAGAIERLQRYVLEASKQCGRSRLMEVESARPWKEWAEDPGLPPSGRFIAHVHGPSRPLPREALPASCFAVGPEGGWTDEELELAQAAGWQVVNLGPRTLRVETAAVAIAAWWNFLTLEGGGAKD